MNPAVREAAEAELGGCERIHIIEPIEVFDCHNFEARSYLCLTDSGGIQEECPSYGVPVLVMRDTTERPEGVDAGTLKLVGTNEEVIYNTFKTLLEDKAEYKKMSSACNPYGDRRQISRYEIGEAEMGAMLYARLQDVLSVKSDEQLTAFLQHWVDLPPESRAKLIDLASIMNTAQQMKRTY